MQILFQGRVLATPTAATILIEGSQVFSGQIGAGQPLDTQIDIANLVSAGGAVSISVTSGILDVGPVFKWPDTAPAWNPSASYAEGDYVEYNGVVYVCQGTTASPGFTPGMSVAWSTAQISSADCRTNILVNGQPPEWPATPVEPRMPDGTEQNPNWAGWGFDVSAGETITFTV
jgi:hypothetical protein